MAEKQMYYENCKIINVVTKDGMSTLQLKSRIKDGKDIIMVVPEWELAAVMTEKPSDATEVRLKRSIIIVDEMYDVLKNRNIRMEDISFISQRLNLKIEGIEEEGTNKMLDVNNKYEIRVGHFDKE